MEQAKAVLDMGEHAVFIWVSYGVAALILALLVFSTLRRIRESERRLQALGGGRRAARDGEAVPHEGREPGRDPR